MVVTTVTFVSRSLGRKHNGESTFIVGVGAAVVVLLGLLTVLLVVLLSTLGDPFNDSPEGEIFLTMLML